MKKDSWLYSDSFLKRAFAIWGHYFVANIIIGGCMLLLFLLLMIAIGGTMRFAKDEATGEQNAPVPGFEENVL